MEIALEKGYTTNKIAQTLARKAVKIGIVIEYYSTEFTGEIFRGINNTLLELSDYKVEGIYGNKESTMGKDRVLKDLKDMMIKDVDGIILCPGIPYKEYNSILNEIYEKGIPLIIITNDIPNCNRLTIIRQNSIMVGELGAELLTLYNTKGNNSLFIGNKDVIGHKEIIEGFTYRLGLAEDIPIAVYETQDDDEMSYCATEKLLKDHPNINGIFIGTSHCIGVCKKIIELEKTREIKIVTVDTSPQIIEYIQKGIIQATIFQNPYLQGRLSVKKIYEFISAKIIPDNLIYINPGIVIKSNCMNFDS